MSPNERYDPKLERYCVLYGPLAKGCTPEMVPGKLAKYGITGARYKWAKVYKGIEMAQNFVFVYWHYSTAPATLFPEIINDAVYKYNVEKGGIENHRKKFSEQANKAARYHEANIMFW